MKRRDAFDLYTDYLIASPSNATASSLSAVLNDALKHDYISDFLSQDDLDPKAFWKEVKPLVRQIEGDDAWICIDDMIIDKPHSTENDLISYHFDHTKGKAVKGINVINFLLCRQLESKPSSSRPQEVNCPLTFELVYKKERFIDPQTGKEKRRSSKTKNEIVQQQLHTLTFLNKVKYQYVLFDTWFGASSNLKQIHHKLKKIFVCPLKTNRLVALSEAQKLKGEFIAVSKLELESQQCRQVWVKGLDFPVSLTRQVFRNKDHSEAELFLITNDTEMSYDFITTIYQKRWKVEEMHKSLKQNTLIGKSPTKMEQSQANHIFASMIAYLKLERLKIKEQMNHFALKSKLYIKMAQQAMEMLRELSLKPYCNS